MNKKLLKQGLMILSLILSVSSANVVVTFNWAEISNPGNAADYSGWEGCFWCWYV